MNQILCVVREHSGSEQRRNVLLTPLLGLACCACPPTLIVVNIALRPALTSQEFLDFLRTVRTIRSLDRPLARNERLSHRRCILRRNVRLKRVAPQRWSPQRAELSRGAVSHSRRSRDLTTECWLIHDQRSTFKMRVSWEWAGGGGAYSVHVNANDTWRT
jgi:hypothetical protein